MRTVFHSMALGLALALGLAVFLAGEPTQVPGAPVAATRVILVVGDGMGLAQWTVARLMTDRPLAVSRLPVIGLVDTRCACTQTTESASSATAYATGHRTRQRFVSMAPDSTPLRTVLEEAEARGLATGLVTTTQIVDATPAAFAAHAVSRYERLDIAKQIAARDIEVLLGGGRSAFTRQDLLDGMRPRYTVVTTPGAFRALDLARTTRLVGLFADSTVFPDTASRPRLPEMARTALELLDRDPDGFFLLLEQEDTDDAHHANMPVGSTLPTILELDQTVAVALDYQARHPETLVVVLGDHETGGLTLFYTDSGLRAEYSTTSHSATMVPVFAGGPGSERFGGWLSNEEVGRLLFEAVGVRETH